MSTPSALQQGDVQHPRSGLQHQRPCKKHRSSTRDVVYKILSLSPTNLSEPETLATPAEGCNASKNQPLPPVDGRLGLQSPHKVRVVGSAVLVAPVLKRHHTYNELHNCGPSPPRSDTPLMFIIVVIAIGVTCVLCTLLPLLSLWTTEGSCAVAWLASLPADMFSPDHDKALLDSVLTGKMARLEAAFAAGASVNGSPELPCPPITAAAARDEVRMISFLIEHGADPNRPVNCELPPSRLAFAIMPGERALHIAANRGNVEIVRLLIGAGADPNLADKRGGTPLLVVLGCCTSLRVGVEMVRLLLEAGADPAQADNAGFVPMHLAAKHGDLELVDMLYDAAPSTCGLNAVSADGRTPLFAACCEGHEEVVSRLLSLGAIQRVDNHSLFPLGVATRKGFLSVVRLLLKDRMRAVGGRTVLPYALYMAIRHHQPRVLRLLLGVDGDKKRSKWANSYFDDRRLIHYGVCLCCPAEVAVLIAAGADETSSGYGRIPRDDIGVDLALEGLRMDRGKEIALRRILEQGPAYRARSWAWPTEEADGGGCGDGKAVASSPPAAPKLPVGLRIVRPNSDTKFFVRVVGRYCLNGYSNYY